MGFRFGANIAVRLAYLYPKLIKGVVALGPLIHALFTQAELQKIPIMYLDVLSRLGLLNIDENNLRLSLSSYSLKNQSLIGRRMPVPMMSVYWKGMKLVLRGFAAHCSLFYGWRYSRNKRKTTL